MEPEIEIEGYFGPKQVSKGKFVEIWLSYTRELLNLSFSREWNEEVVQILEKVKEQAEKTFEAKLEQQEESKN